MTLLCEPYLLDPGPGAVHVVWHTDRPGGRHVVLVGPAVAGMSGADAVAAATGAAPAGAGWRRVPGTSRALSRLADDAGAGIVRRPVHRHLARIDGLPAGRTPYRVVSVDDSAPPAVSAGYTLAPAAALDTPVRLLLTSDHQLRPMVAVNMALVAATVGERLDGVLMAGDLVNVADRAVDWFGGGDGPGFFGAMSGRGGAGAPLLPHSPLFPAIGNHEVMGDGGSTLDERFHAARPGRWNVTSYEELFPLPASDSGGPRWWSRRIGEVHVISLFATRMWQPDGAGATFREAAEDLADPGRWRGGQFLFEPVARGSAQHDFLARELASPACRSARFRVVMLHHPAHGLGRHSTPAFTDPVRTVERDPDTGAVAAVRYDYPLAADQLLRDVEPLLDDAGVHLVLTGHSHLWNRFRSASGVHWLETSNVGNSYGAYDRSSGRSRPLPAGPDYVPRGDPGGLSPVVPTVAPVPGPDGAPLPFLADDAVTAFAILDSGAGVVRSYRFDTRRPTDGVLLFDEFSLAPGDAPAAPARPEAPVG